MKQMSIGGGFEKYTTATRGERFLAEMDSIVPWEDRRRIIAPYYPKAARVSSGTSECKGARGGQSHEDDPRGGCHWGQCVDSVCLTELLNGVEARGWGGSAYQG